MIKTIEQVKALVRATAPEDRLDLLTEVYLETDSSEIERFAESWLPVAGYEGFYEVSDMGNVRSLPREKINKRGQTVKVKGRTLSLRNKPQGYVMVSLCGKGKEQRLLVHRLVARAFLPNPENLKTVNHKDFNRSNNCLLNLEWASYYQNNHHCIENKKPKRTFDGIKYYNLMDTEKVLKIREMRRCGATYKEITGAIGCSVVTAINVVKRKTWKHL